MKKSLFVAAILLAAVCVTIGLCTRRTAADAPHDVRADSVRALAVALVARADSLSSAGCGDEPPHLVGEAYIEAAECMARARSLWSDVPVDTAAEALLMSRLDMLDTLLTRQIEMLDSIPSATRPLLRRKARIAALRR